MSSNTFLAIGVASENSPYGANFFTSGFSEDSRPIGGIQAL